jgi:plastocyanin
LIMTKTLPIFMLLLLLTGCGFGGPAHSPPVARAAAVVDMNFHSFSPAAVTIRAGDSVEWRNTSIIPHTVTDDAALAGRAGNATLPAGAAAFHSGRIPPGEIYVHAFTVPGTYRYFCKYHEDHGMVGTVIVTR